MKMRFDRTQLTNVRNAIQIIESRQGTRAALEQATRTADINGREVPPANRKVNIQNHITNYISHYLADENIDTFAQFFTNMLDQRIEKAEAEIVKMGIAPAPTEEKAKGRKAPA
jgi:hypothetical protein